MSDPAILAVILFLSSFLGSICGVLATVALLEYRARIKPEKTKPKRKYTRKPKTEETPRVAGIKAFSEAPVK